MLTALFCWFLSFLPPGAISMCTEMARDPFLLAASSHATDLQLPSESSTLSSSDVPGMALYRPQGDGKFLDLCCFINAPAWEIAADETGRWASGRRSR